MTKNIRFLYFSFVFNDLFVREDACNSVRSGRRAGATVIFIIPFLLAISWAIQTRGPIWNIRIGPRGRVLYQSKIRKLSLSAKNWHLSCVPWLQQPDSVQMNQLDCPGVASDSLARRISVSGRERTPGTRSARTEIQRRQRVAQQPGQFNLIWTSTPAARSSFINASTVLSVGSTISISRLCVLISY